MGKSQDDYERELDILFQRIADQEEKAVLARLRNTCHRADEETIRQFYLAARSSALSEGLTGRAAQVRANAMVETMLDLGVLDEHLEVKDDDENSQ
jgi:hypothetical protein